MSVETNHRYPLSRIFIGSEKTVVVCESQLFVLDSQSGTLLASATVNSADKSVSSIVRIASVDNSYHHLVTSGDDKRLRVWSIHDLKELSCREIPKRANVLRLRQDGQTILVADKFGDIFSYPFKAPEPKPQPAAQSGDGAASSSKFVALAMHDNPEGTLILGHASIITDFILTHDETLVISADRDEHIRVSWYPEGWDVERYCMGHKKFVSALEIPLCSPSTLISGGGDSDLSVWDFCAGRIIGRIPVWEHIRPFLKVKGGRRKWKENGEGTKSANGKKNKKKNMGEDKAATDAETGSRADTPMDMGAAQANSAEVYNEEVLVISKITHARFGDVDVILFSAVGCSAVFYFKWPSSLDFTGVEIHSLDLNNPIIEFVVVKSGTIWVSVDPTWPTHPAATGTTKSVDSRRIRRLVLRDDVIIEASSESQLEQSLNEGCVVKGTGHEIQALNMYEPLVALPKTIDPDSADGAAEEPDATVPIEVTSGPGLRASARQKAKEQLEKRKALTQEITQRASKQPRVEET